MISNLQYADIYDAVAKACPEASPHEALKCFAREADLRQGHPKPHALLTKLQRTHSVQKLLDSGVAIRPQASQAPGQCDADHITLHPRLCSAAERFLVLRGSAESMPFDLLCDNGCISGSAPACLAMMEDYRCNTAFQKTHSLFFGFGAADVAALWTLGQAAVSAGGLWDLGGRALDKFCRTFGIDRPLAAKRQSSASRPNGLFLTVAGWRPGEWSPTEPGRLADVVKHFTGLTQHLALNLERVRCWQPDAAALEGLRFAARYGGDDAQQAICRLAQESAKPICSGPVRRHSEFSTALLQFRQILRRPAAPEEVARAFEAVEDALQQHLIGPLMAQANACDEPMARNSLALLARTSRLAHLSGLKLDHQLVRAFRSPEHPFGHRADLDQWLALVDRFLKLCGEISSGPAHKGRRTKGTR